MQEDQEISRKVRFSLQKIFGDLQYSDLGSILKKKTKLQRLRRIISEENENKCKKNVAHVLIINSFSSVIFYSYSFLSFSRLLGQNFLENTLEGPGRELGVVSYTVVAFPVIIPPISGGWVDTKGGFIFWRAHRNLWMPHKPWWGSCWG